MTTPHHTRRDFIKEVCAAVPAASLCAIATACVSDRSATTGPPPQDSVDVLSNGVDIHLDKVPTLTASGGSLTITAEQIIVIHPDAQSTSYRAFTNICTHAGCALSSFTGSRIRCFCHGSEFDVEGTNVAGPAPLPLTRLATSVDATGTILSVRRV